MERRNNMKTTIYRYWPDGGGGYEDYPSLEDAAQGGYPYRLADDDPRRWWVYGSEEDADADEGGDGSMAVAEITEIREREGYWTDTRGAQHPEPEVTP